MRCGPLRHRVTILSPTGGTPDAYGQVPPGFSSYGHAWTRIEPATGRDIEFAKSFDAIVTHKVTMRYQSGIVSGMQLQFGTEVYAINAVLDFEKRRRWLTLFCTQKT